MLDILCQEVRYCTLRLRSSVRTESKVDQRIGAHLNSLLQERGISAERLAAEARALGLPWSRTTLKNLFAGRRRLSVGEFLVLSDLIARAADLPEPLPLEDLLPEGDLVDLGGLLVDAKALRGLVGGRRLRTRDVTTVQDDPRLRLRVSSDIVPGLTFEIVDALAREAVTTANDVLRDSAGEAEMKAAATWGTIPEVIVITAYRKWGRSLNAERDARLEDCGAASSAARGHATRRATEQLAHDLPYVRRALLIAIGVREVDAALMVAEGAGDIEIGLARRLRTISEFVVLAASTHFGLLRPADVDPRFHRTVAYPGITGKRSDPDGRDEALDRLAARLRPLLDPKKLRALIEMRDGSKPTAAGRRR